LLLKIEEMMTIGPHVPIVSLSTSLKDSILEMTTKRLGATCVVDEKGKLCGIITDGDLRRLLQGTTDVSAVTADQVMTRKPKTILLGALAATALREMENFNITQLIIVDEEDHPVGMVHLHDLVKAGLATREQG
jgi:Predicted signal-transduction protein containing cAMP-binding and CBS domains